MTDRTVTELVIDSNTSGAADYERAMAGAEAATRRTSDAANDFTINLLAIGTGAVAAAVAIKQGIDKVVEANKGLADMAALAERVGLSLRDLQGVQFGARVAGLSDNAINSGLEKSAELLNDARRNVNSLSKEFEANGLSIYKANGQLITQNQLLQISGDLIRRAQTPQDAIAIAQMLGYTKEWIPFLKQSADTLRNLGDDAERAGAVIDEATVQRAAEFDRNWRKSSVEFSSYMKSALLGLLPFVDNLIERAAKFVKSIDRKTVEDAANRQLGALSDNVGFSREGGFRIGITDETRQAMADWNDGNKTFLEKLGAMVSGLRSTVQRLSPDDLKFANGSGESIKDTSGWMDEGRWQAQANSWRTASQGFLAGADQVGEGFSKVASRARDANDAVDRALNSLRRHTEQQLADAAAMGQGVAVQARYRAAAAERAAIEANGGKETATQAAAFRQLTKDAGDAAVALERARVAQDIKFGRDTALLSPQDVQIAQQLKGLYPDVATALDSAEAAQLRYNATLKDFGNQVGNAAVSNLTDFEMGLKSGGDAVRDFEKQFIRATLNMINQWLVFKALGAFGSFGGGSITSLFPSAHGNAFSAGAVVPFAQGGVIDRPTIAPMALMGEAGPEAVMPLRRDSRGNLGIASGGGNTTISYQIDATGADSGTVERIYRVLESHGRSLAAQGKAMTSQARYAQTGVA